MFDTLTILLDLDSGGLEQKMAGTMHGLLDVLEKLKGKKLDWGEILNGEAFSSIYWSAIMTKLFSPANLITFFSAMGALGITTAMQIQQAGAGAGGAIGGNVSLIGQIGQQAQSILGQLGTRGGSLQSVANTLAFFMNMFGNMQDATQATTLLDGALRSVGDSLNNLDLSSFGSFLNNIGATTLPQVIDAVSALTSAVTKSGEQIGFGGIVSDLMSFSETAQALGTPLKSIDNYIVAFGSSVGKLGLDNTTNLFKTFDSAVSGANLPLAEASGGLGKLRDLLNKGDIQGGLDAVSSGVNQLSPGQIDMINKSLGLTGIGIDGSVKKFLELQSQIDYTSLSGKSAQDYLTGRINATTTSVDNLDAAYNTLSGDISKAFTPVIKILSNVDALIGAIIGAIAGAIGGAIIGAPLGPVGMIGGGLLGLISGGISGANLGNILNQLIKGKKTNIPSAQNQEAAASSTPATAGSVHFNAVINSTGGVFTPQHQLAQAQYVQKNQYHSYMGTGAANMTLGQGLSSVMGGAGL